MADIFKNKKANVSKLLDFGFIKTDRIYEYKTKILDEEFQLIVTVTPQNKITTKLIEIETGSPYTLHLVEGASGTFIGQVREAYENVLEKIADECFEVNVFKSEDSLQLIEYVRQKYGDELEFLWEKFAGNAVTRRKDNKKWYAAFLTVSKQKLGFEENEIVEILDIRAENVENLIDNTTIFPGYHMNKKHWITIILDGSVPIEKTKSLLDKSYILCG